MENVLLGREPERGGMFVMAVVGTLAVGVAGAVMVLFRSKGPEAPPPAVASRSPEVRSLGKAASPIHSAENPASSPKVNVQRPPEPEPMRWGRPGPGPGPIRWPTRRPGVPPERTAPVQPLPPLLPSEEVQAARSTWDGVWRKQYELLPAIHLRLSGASVEGTLAPNWKATLRLVGGQVIGDGVEFAVEHGVLRTRYRMSLIGEDKARVEAWTSEGDWQGSLAKAQNAVRTPQQGMVARRVLEQKAKQLQRAVSLGIFTRRPD